MPWLPRVNSVLDVWYPGQEGGTAVADVLWGDYNPGGRLPITFPVTEGQLPLVYNHKPTGAATTTSISPDRRSFPLAMA